MQSILNNGTCPGKDINVDEVSKTFSELLKVPTITKAQFDHDDEHVLCFSTEWCYSDVVQKEKSSFVKTYTLLKDSLTTGKGSPIVYESLPTINDHV